MAREDAYGSVHSTKNLALFKKRLAEQHTAAEHEILLKLEAEEKAKYLRPEKGK